MVPYLLVMKTSDKGLAFIGKEEGEVLHVYTDVAGVKTIGVGHALKPGESFPSGITHDQAIELLRSDVSVAEVVIGKFVKVSLTQNQFDALCSFTFNCGGGALMKSSALVKLNAGDYDGAADALLLWNKCKDPKTGQTIVNKVLDARRHRERAVFLTPDEPVAEQANESSDDAPVVSDPAPVQDAVPTVQTPVTLQPNPTLVGTVSSLFSSLFGRKG